MRLLAGEPGDDTQVRLESHAPAASASPRSKQRRRRRGLAHRERSPGWVTIMPMTGVPHVHGPARHEPGIVTCLRSAILLAGGVAAGPPPGRCPTPPGSSGCPVPAAPRTGPARAERLGQLRRTRPGGTFGAVLQTRGAPWCRWPTPPAEALAAPLLGPAAKHAKPEARPGKVRRTSQQAPRPQPRSTGEYSVYIGTAERRVLHA